MLGKWIHLGHRLGECWVDETRSITYIHVPKNASSFIKGCLIGSGGFWKHSETLVISNETLIVLRDPIERWCSGIAQYQYNSKQFDMTLDEAFNTITFDDHTDLQTYFLQGVDLSKATYMLADDTLRITLEKWVRERGYHTNISIAHSYNASVGDERENIKSQYLDILASRPDLVLQLKNHFAADYELFNKVKFYD
jgi:hypothetical protein